MTSKSIEDAVRELADREAIRDLARRYAHHVWCRDVSRVVELFVEDAELDTGEGPTLRGRSALRATYQRTLPGADLQPFVHNHVIDVEGDHATGTCYLDLRATVDGRSMIGAGVYQDRYVRIDREWKFASRSLRMRHFVPLREGWAEAAAGDTARPTRS